MIEREFESLLTAYLDGNIREDELVELERAVQENPRFKGRFQAEFRLQTLLHEAACARRELTGLSAGRILRIGRRWTASQGVAVAASAACLLFAVLFLAMLLHNPPRRRQPAIGRFLQVGGVVRTAAEGHATNLLVRDGQPVLEGDRIVCDSAMRSLIELTDGSLLCLEGGSAITVERNQSDDIEIFLDRGRVLFEVARQDPNAHRVVVRTAQATATVLGTLFSIEAQDTWTRADVYEGLVHLRQDQTGDVVHVASEQCAEAWSDGFLQVHELSQRRGILGSPEMVLSPTDDMNTHEGRPENERWLYVEGGRRVTYLKFDVPHIETIRTARLQLTQMFDVGKGTLSFHEGSHSRWTELDQSMEQTPTPLREIARHTGVVGINQTVEVDVSELITGPGTYTIIVMLDAAGNDDISFGSKETPIGPKLILNEKYSARSPQVAGIVPNDAGAVGESSRYTVLSPTDDAYLEDGKLFNRQYLHLEKHRRTVFFRFEVPDNGPVQEARLQLSQTLDTGSGTIQFFEGSHSNWTEQDLTAERAPTPVREIARYTGIVGPYDTISVDVSDLIAGPDVYTIIATLDAQGISDVAFGSKESPMGPRLAIRWQQEGP
jgi:ferric-dicitrate binding protein FerR (iron transport regulator)